MGDFIQPLDLVIFFAFLIFAMAVGLIAGRKEETSEDFFLAGRKIPWWGVAGSIFGSNVSANHMVGMMGIGFSIGFAQSHFELGAIFGLMLLPKMDPIVHAIYGIFLPGDARRRGLCGRETRRHREIRSVSINSADVSQQFS